MTVRFQACLVFPFSSRFGLLCAQTRSIERLPASNRLDLRVALRHPIDIHPAAHLRLLPPSPRRLPELLCRALPRIIVRPHICASQVTSRKPLDVKVSIVLQHGLDHALALLLQLRNAVLHDTLPFQAHREKLVELAQLVAVQVAFAGLCYCAEELPAHVWILVRAVCAHLLRHPVPPDSEADPLHDVVGVAGAADGVAVGAADGFRALESFWVVAEEVVLGGFGEVAEAFGFGSEDGGDFWGEDVFAKGGLDSFAVEAAGAMNEGFFPEGFAAQARGEVHPLDGVAGHGAVEDLAVGKEGGFDRAGDDHGLVVGQWLIVRGEGSRMHLRFRDTQQRRGRSQQSRECNRCHHCLCRRCRCCGCKRLQALAPMPVDVSLIERERGYG
jgi:hypothetical protein